MSGTAEEFDEHRKVLFGVAYRMLGTVADAEDMVQEAYLRWREAPHGEIDSPRAYLTTVVTRLCIDHLRSARVRRETYVGPWLPEPVLADALPDEPVAMAESLSMAFLVLLESLTPAERAALLLREVFDYEYAEIAEALGKTEANCRQLVRRARERISDRRPRFSASPDEQSRIVEQFLAAVGTGDIAGMVGMLAADATLVSDGGGKVKAALNPILGADRVARFFAGIAPKLPPNLRTHAAVVNGQPGVVATLDGHPQGVLAFRIGSAGIESVYLVSNPDKLRHLAPE
jgi:RNA polymerase sigma-70 factor (ECF subfamily)